VDPEPRADTTFGWAGRHGSGDLEVGKPGPDAVAVSAEDGEIFGLDVELVGLVGNGQGTTGDVALRVRMEGCRIRVGAGPVALPYVRATTSINNGLLVTK
jgi:hypothetical protein